MNNLSYQNICTAYGILKVARATDNTELRAGIEAAFLPYLLEGENPNLNNAKKPPHQWFGFVPLELYLQTKRPEYLERGIELAERQYEQPDENGMPGYTARWFVDDIYGATVMQSLAYACTGKRKYLERAVKQVITYTDKLQRDNGLFHHGPSSPFYWGRANGWCAAAMTELLTIMPESHPSYSNVLQSYRSMMTTLLTYQTEGGMWRQLIDQESWDETSCTGMFLYAFSEGVASDWLPQKTYGMATERGMKALASYVDDQGRLENVCIGTSLGETIEFYLDRPRKTGDAHGQAGLLWAIASMIEAKRHR
jgi:rhamnogalacturonyl hydrolase YesR